MLFRKQQSVAVLACRPDVDVSSGQTDAWAALETLTQDLHGVDEAGDQVELFLTAVHQAVGADVVICSSGSGREPTLRIGNNKMPASWCEQFATRALQAVAQTNRDLVQLGEGRLPQLHPTDPQGVLMARLSKSRELWVMALRFNVTPFAPRDVNAFSLARQIFLNHRQHDRLYETLKGTLLGLAGCLTAAIDARDPYARGHSERVARIAGRLGAAMSLDSRVIGDIYLAGLLHDVGKIGIADQLLARPGKLTAQDFVALQQHTIIGDTIVSGIKQLEHLSAGVRHHHERFDGRGYPDGLAGQRIPLLGRLLAVADVCEALASDRSYRSALSPEQIDAILSAGAGTQWDPEIIGHWRACRQEILSICRRPVDPSASLAETGTGTSSS